MKNKRIIQAYDSINPGAAEKAKMLDAILAQTDLKDEPRKISREPNVRTVRPAKKRRNNHFLPIAAALAMILTAGFVLLRMARQQEDITYTQPEPVRLGTSYDAVLTKYKTALEEKWLPDQCQIEDICEFITQVNYTALDVGYAIIDLDGNGREELVITNGQGLVWDLYTLLEDETPVHVHCQENGWPVYRLYENAVIGMEDFSSDGIVYEYYTFRDTGFAGPELTLRQGSGMFTCEPVGEEAYFITEAEAEATMAEYQLLDLDQTSLLTLVSEEIANQYRYGDSVALAGIIAKYNNAIAQGWTKEQCEIEGISPRVQAGYDVTKAGYAFLDLDGDGREELIIAEESTSRTDNIWDLYTTLEDGTPIQLWVDELEGGQCKLCQDNVISISYSMKDELEQTFYKLEDSQLSMLGQLQWEDEDTVFHTDAQGNTRQVTSREGQAIGYSYESQKMDLTWLGKHQDTDALERYTPVLEKYRTALLENWDKDKCFENDISAIAAFGADTRTALGWCLRDIDGNGTEELLISYGGESGTVVDMYCLQPEELRDEDMVRTQGGTSYPLAVENGICHLAKSEGSITYTLCEDGTLIYQIIYEKGTSWCYYQVMPWGLELQGVLMYRGDNENAKAYSYGPHENDQTYITKEEAGSYLSAHVPVGRQPVTPLVDWDQYEVAPQTAYTSVIELYRQALEEKWDMEQCSVHDISLMISYFADEPERISAQLLDLDSNGVDELIITDGVMIYDLYTVKNGSPVKLLTGWERNAYRLCQNNVIYNQGSGGAAHNVFNYYQILDGELVLVESVVFDAIKDFDNPWFRSSDGETPEAPITEDEAYRIMDSYSFISMLGIDLLDE